MWKPTWREPKERKREIQGSKSGVLISLVTKGRRNIEEGGKVRERFFLLLCLFIAGKLAYSNCKMNTS